MPLHTQLMLCAATILPLSGCGGMDCGPTNYDVYTVDSITATALAYKHEMPAPEDMYYAPADELSALPGEPLTYNRLTLKVTAATIIAHQTSAPRVPYLQWSMFEVAHACTPLTWRVLKDEIADLTITSTGNISSEYPAGANLAALFYITGISEPFEISYSKDGQSWSYTAAEYSELRSLATETLRLRLGYAPDSVQDHIFSVTYHLKDGRVLTATTQKVTVTPLVSVSGTETAANSTVDRAAL